ncbi:Protein C01H6.3 [Aphelenchoides avenae]|nr:Protein C01H6.3 [Aphelenchus avenae]
MPPPVLIPCPHCDRLYTRFSIRIHLAQCPENPNREAKSADRISAKKRPKPNVVSPVARRSHSEGSRRPRTHTISGGEKVTRSMSNPTSGSRVCFVCGTKSDEPSLKSHEKNCEKEWRKLRAKIPSYIRTNSPKRVQIPSVDGTKDCQRLNTYATESAERAQRARCNRCAMNIPFNEAPEHRCTRFQPTVEFFF